MSGVVQTVDDALALTPNMRLALTIITGRLRGDCGQWDWDERTWKRSQK